MLKILRTVTMSPEQYDIVLCDGMRNPKNSWDRSDSYITHIEDEETEATANYEFFLGENDEKLANTLAIGGPVHAKYRRMMPIWVTINAPLYWWKEFDTYKVGTVCNSCSTMHKIHAKEFTVEDFSSEYLLDDEVYKDIYPRGTNSMFPCIEEVDESETCCTPMTMLKITIKALNFYRERFLETVKDKSLPKEERDRLALTFWRQLIQLLPSSYNQTRTVMLNYEVISQMDYWRENHKLTEWHTFCDWIKEQKYYLPLIRPNKKTEVAVSCPNPDFPNIGGKVCIRLDLTPGRYGCASFSNRMNHLLGQGVTVSKYVYDVSGFKEFGINLITSDKVLHDFKRVGVMVEESPYLISNEMIMEM